MDKVTQLSIVKTAIAEKLVFKAVQLRFPNVRIVENTLSNWKKRYLQLLLKHERTGKAREQASKQAEDEYLGWRKRGAPTLLMTEWHDELLAMLRGIRDSHGRVCPIIVVSVAKAILESRGQERHLHENGGTLQLSKSWARKIITGKNGLGWVKRKATTTRKLTEEEKKEAAQQMKTLNEKIKKYNPALVFEMDETMAPWAPVDNYTYAEKGTETIVIQGAGDKRGNTVTVTVSKTGRLLPLHLIWSGQTNQSIPKLRQNVVWPDGFFNSYAGVTGMRVDKNGNEIKKTNKWQNEHTIGEYCLNVLNPVILEERKKEQKNENQYEMKDRALLIMDNHHSHHSKMAKGCLATCNCDIEFLPAQTTDWTSVLDVAINRTVKEHLRASWSKWASQEIIAQLRKKLAPANVKLNINTKNLKPLTAEWLIDMWNDLKGKTDIVLNGWRKVEENVEKASMPAANRAEPIVVN